MSTVTRFTRHVERHEHYDCLETVLVHQLELTPPLSLLPSSLVGIFPSRQFCFSSEIPMSVDVGIRLGSLEIMALLGKGGMGKVYRARDTKLKRDVAVKILPDEFSRDAD